MIRNPCDVTSAQHLRLADKGNTRCSELWGTLTLVVRQARRYSSQWRRDMRKPARLP